MCVREREREMGNNSIWKEMVACERPRWKMMRKCEFSMKKGCGTVFDLQPRNEVCVL